MQKNDDINFNLFDDGDIDSDFILEKLDKIRPNHYKLKIKDLDFEAKDIMKSLMTDEEYEGFLLGNILKYVLRARKKNGLDDMKKAKVYMEWLIEEVENKKCQNLF